METESITKVDIADHYFGGRLAAVFDAERFRDSLRKAGLSQSELARRIGISQSAIGKLAAGGAYGSKHMHRIARELGTSPAYLMGETDDPSEGALPPPSALAIAEQLDAVLIPEVQVSYSMGGGSVIEDWPVVRQVPFSRDWLRSFTASSPEHLAVARGDGDSMMPTILDGDLVILDLSQKTPRQQDRIWALSYGGLGMIKRVRALPDGSYQVNSDNPAVTPIHAADGEMQVVGRVVGVVRRI